MAADYEQRRPGDGLLERVRRLPPAQPDPRDKVYKIISTAIVEGPASIEKLAKTGAGLNGTNMHSMMGTSNIAAIEGPATYLSFLQYGGKPDNSPYNDRVRSDAYHLISGHGAVGLKAAQAGGLKLDDPKRSLGSSFYSTTLQQVVVEAGAETIELYARQGGTFKPTEDLVRGLDSLSLQAAKTKDNDEKRKAVAALNMFRVVSGKTPADIKVQETHDCEASTKTYAARATAEASLKRSRAPVA